MLFVTFCRPKPCSNRKKSLQSLRNTEMFLPEVLVGFFRMVRHPKAVEHLFLGVTVLTRRETSEGSSQATPEARPSEACGMWMHSKLESIPVLNSKHRCSRLSNVNTYNQRWLISLAHRFQFLERRTNSASFAIGNLIQTASVAEPSHRNHFYKPQRLTQRQQRQLRQQRQPSAMASI